MVVSPRPSSTCFKRAKAMSAVSWKTSGAIRCASSSAWLDTQFGERGHAVSRPPDTPSVVCTFPGASREDCGEDAHKYDPSQKMFHCLPSIIYGIHQSYNRQLLCFCFNIDGHDPLPPKGGNIIWVYIIGMRLGITFPPAGLRRRQVAILFPPLPLPGCRGQLSRLLY